MTMSITLAALVGGALGAGVTLAVTQSGSSPAPMVTLPTAASGAPSSLPTNFNVAAIAARVEPAVVDITASGPAGQDEGTGMILTASGVVLTNNHVIEGSTRLTAQVNGSGRSYAATVLGTDSTSDVALLQLHGSSSFKTITLGDSAAVKVGDQVVAIGNALALPGQETVTDGIISAMDRSISVSDSMTGLAENLSGLFQTSAPINPGNSGGPLVDAAGQVIGINTAQAASTSSGETASNVGFAIPINTAMSIARQIDAAKPSFSVQIGPHAIMGVDVVGVAQAESAYGYTPPVDKGAVVVGVAPGDPAQSAGLAQGDVITSLDGVAINSTSDLTARLNLHKVGDRVSVGWVDTHGKHHSASLTLVRGPNA
jgi:S1-C subfamily serine protease